MKFYAESPQIQFFVTIQVTLKITQRQMFNYWKTFDIEENSVHRGWLLFTSDIHHGLRGSASPVLITTAGLVSGIKGLALATESTLLYIAKISVTCDYVSDPYNCAKFSANPFTSREVCGNGWKITFIFIICPIAIAYSMGQIINSVCLCQWLCPSVCLSASHSCISWSIHAKSGTEVTTPWK